ncbi:MAG: hypothetical protein AB2L14_07825 [Candidatus Xenobiia bacterium LiM19]
MTRIELRKLEETEDSLVPGEVIGMITISDDNQPNAIVDDVEMKTRLEAIVAAELTVLNGDRTGLRNVTVARQVRAGDSGYVNALLERIAKKDFRILGTVLE